MLTGGGGGGGTLPPTATGGGGGGGAIGAESAAGDGCGSGGGGGGGGPATGRLSANKPTQFKLGIQTCMVMFKLERVCVAIMLAHLEQHWAEAGVEKLWALAQRLLEPLSLDSCPQ